ncbi:MAG: CHASE domain-containing protein [Sulfuricurvum sp.]|uniref:CHASE domain-containing protein n=1 Tax=Sulfuricurvum sp. TaxID=2025608 RepID=UPI002610B000|nr:CHASE domain-containing protein [Sulfuricurvum sp.]MDD5118665.1 CHASE domain-containing protein [Sulfuricurvum sp.]
MIHRRLVTVSGLIFSIIVVVLVWWGADRYFFTRSQNLFEHYVHENCTAIDRRIHRYENALLSGVGFMQGSDYVSRKEWRQFVQTLNPKKYYPGVQGIGYSIMLFPNQVSAIEKRMKEEGYPRFVLKPAGKRERYSAILYLEPLDKRNLAAIGYDMYSDPIRHEAMQRAADTGRASISGKVKLVQEIDEKVQAGFLMYLPFYKTGEPINTIEERRRALVGFVYSPFRMNDLIDSMEAHDTMVKIEIYDSPQRSKEHLLYRSERYGYSSKHTSHRTITLGGKVWHLYYYSTRQFDSSTNGFYPILVAMGGLGIYFLLFYIILELLYSRKMLQKNTLEIESSRSWLKRLLDSSVDGIHILDTDGKLIECSPSFLQMLGYDVSDIPKLSVYDWEAKLSSEQIRNALYAVASVPMSFESVFRRKDGTLFDAEITARRIDIDGIQYLYASFREITKRKETERLLKESEEFYRTMFVSINEAVCILSEDIIIDCNDQAMHLFEISKQHLIGMNIFDTARNIVCRENSFAFYLDTAYNGDSTTTECSLTLKTHNETKIVEFTLSGFGRNDSNKLVMIARDITERIEKEKLFKMQTRQAQMGEMISMIAHQWRQPLAIINAITSQMRLQRLMDGNEDETEQENLRKIEEQCIHLSQTITDYRDFFRPDKPKEAFSFHTLMSHALDLIDHTLKNNGIEIEVISNSDPKLFTYRNEVLQVLIALLKNSLDAFEESRVNQGKIKVTIAQEGNFGVISIHDNAGGIPPEVMKKLFVPYFTTKNQQYGTGLGLYMSKVIIEEHCGGIIEVFSEGNETTFSIKLPYGNNGSSNV